jgi:tripartite-type tricarboxylate transporter receptor subunit TctC
VPTVVEQGVPGFTIAGWQGWFMPGGTPAPIVERVQQELVKTLAQPDVHARIKAMGNDVVGSTPAEFDAYYRSEIARFAKVIAAAHIPRQ